MDKVEIAENLVVPMDAIAPGLSGLKITFVNVFGVSHEDGSWTLIDAAIPFSASRIKSWAEEKLWARAECDRADAWALRPRERGERPGGRVGRADLRASAWSFRT